MNIYIQTAMWMKMAPAYAYLFMGKLEKHLTLIANQHIHTWKCFVDDIFIIWTINTNDLSNII